MSNTIYDRSVVENDDILLGIGIEECEQAERDELDNDDSKVIARWQTDKNLQLYTRYL